ncbi:MAG: hypothetical protein KKH21_07235 [Gammaproteobacteria bacterium]|nr:hypothetical protein [Gammaproteobacteria bacterium]
MSAPDDELVRRYREASAQEDARPGAHVRDAVRAHAQMMAAAAATAPAPSANASSRAAANQSRWKLSALATVALVGLTGLLMLQFERGTPEERDIAFGQRRAQAPAPAAVPELPPPATPAMPEASQGSAHDLARLPPQSHRTKTCGSAYSAYRAYRPVQPTCQNSAACRAYRARSGSTCAC